jgi:hypothetical protein
MSTAISGPAIGLFSPLVPAPGEGQAADVAPHWERVLDELARLGKLAGDWDGQGALAPAPANVGRALAWVKEMSRWPGALLPTHVFPGTTGEVVLEWRWGPFHLIAEIGKPSSRN